MPIIWFLSIGKRMSAGKDTGLTYTLQALTESGLKPPLDLTGFASFGGREISIVHIVDKGHHTFHIHLLIIPMGHV